MNKKSVQLFGILNVTPDSFSDGGKFFSKEKALKQAEFLFANGADVVDVGGESTRPGAEEVSIEEEWRRVGEVLQELIKKYGADKISLDTQKPEIAKRFLDIGGKILNDVSGFSKIGMKKIAAKFDKIIVAYFFTQEEMNGRKIDDIELVIKKLLKRKQELIEFGVSPEKIILDPGIGVDKTVELNFQLLKIASLLPKEQVFIAHSRKRFLGSKRFEVEPNLTAAKTAIKSGAKFLRVHDPENYKELVKKYKKTS